MKKQFINLDMFESSDPKQEYFNQLYVNITTGKRFEQKGDFQKAANLYESVLIYDPKDTKTRARLIKCYRKLLLPEKAEIHLNYIMQSDPHLFQTLQHVENKNFESEKFAGSLMIHDQLYKKIETSRNFNQELSNINDSEAVENSLTVDEILAHSGAKILKMIDNEELFKETIACQTLNNSNKLNKYHKIQKRFQESYYLRNIVGNLEFYREELNVLPNSLSGDKLIYQEIQEIVRTFEKAKDDLYQQKPFYMVNRRKPTQYHVNDRRHVKDLVHLHVSKYINSIVQHCLFGEIWRAQREAELAMAFMKKKFYRPLELVNTLYDAFGLALYLVNQDVPKWSDELNNNRILYLFGSNIVKNNCYNNVYKESYFGPKRSTK